MALCVNQSGTWRNITTQCVNQSSTWRKVLDSCVNQSGTWRCHGMTAPTVTLSASPTSIVQGAGTCSVLTWSSTKATSTSSNFGATSTSGTCNRTPTSTITYCICGINAFATSSTATATVTVTAPALGSSFQGGFLIRRSGGVNWIVAPASSQVARIWASRNDAITTAQQVSGCSGWFVPSCGQMQNPGYVCRQYWDTDCNFLFWSNTDFNACAAWSVGGNSGTAYTDLGKYFTLRVRAFRCVTY
jgi:hypothetical protein